MAGRQEGQYRVQEAAELLPAKRDDPSLWGPYELPPAVDQKVGVHYWPDWVLAEERALPSYLNGETYNHYSSALNIYERWRVMLERAREEGVLNEQMLTARPLPPGHPTAAAAAACLNCLRHRPLLVVAKQSRRAPL